MELPEAQWFVQNM
jgi:hypothetical protein